MKKMFSKVVFFCAFILLTSIISIDVNAEENIITEMSGEAESLETESIEKEPEETEEISEESEQKNDPLIEEQQTESTNIHGIWDDDPIDETFNFTSISQKSSTLIGFKGKIIATAKGKEDNYFIDIEFSVGNYNGTGYSFMHHKRDGQLDEVTGDFELEFPRQKDNAVLKVKLMYSNGTYIEDTFILKNKEPFTILPPDYYNINYSMELDVKAEDFSKNESLSTDIEVKIGSDLYNFSYEKLDFKDKDIDHIYLNFSNKRYKAGEKYQITIVDEQGYYTIYNGSVKDYGSNHFSVEIKNEIYDASTEFKYTISNKFKKEIFEDDQYDVILELDGEKYENLYNYITSGKTEEFVFTLTPNLKKAGSTYSLSVTSKNLGITKTVKGVIKHDNRIDKIYGIKSEPLYDDNSSFTLYLKPTDTYDEFNLCDDKITIIVTIAGKKYTYRIDSYDILDNWIIFEATPLKVKLGKIYKRGTPYFIEVKGDNTGSYLKVSKVVQHSDSPPSLMIDNGRITHQDQYIRGETDDRSSVVLKIGKKTYRKKANSNGRFKFKIKQMKIGSKFKITVTSPINGNKRTRTWKVKKPKMSIKVPNDVTKDSKTISGTLKGAKKGDYIVANINGKKYKGKINYKKNQFSINVSNLSVGNTTLTVYNKFKQKIISHNEHIYLSNSIYVGMTTDQVLQTTFGRPSTINRYNSGALEQWVYRYSYRTTYIYVQNGVVTSFSEIG